MKTASSGTLEVENGLAICTLYYLAYTFSNMYIVHLYLYIIFSFKNNYIFCFSLSWLHSPILLPCPERKQAPSQLAINNNNNNNNNKNSNINYNNSKETKSAKSGDSAWIPGEHKAVKVEAGSVQGPSDECSQGFSDGRGIEEGFQGPSEEAREAMEDEGPGDPEAEKIKEQHLDFSTLLYCKLALKRKARRNKCSKKKRMIHFNQGVTKRCRLSWLTNSDTVYEPQCGGGGCVGSQPMSTLLCTWSRNKLWRSNSISNL
jgi:hypothetical protein